MTICSDNYDNIIIIITVIYYRKMGMPSRVLFGTVQSARRTIREETKNKLK